MTLARLRGKDELEAHYLAVKRRLQATEARAAHVHLATGAPLMRPRMVYVTKDLEPQVTRKARTLYSQPIGPMFIPQTFGNLVFPRQIARRITAEICNKYGITIHDLRSVRRNHYVMEAKRELCFRMRRETSLSLPQIGAMIGKDHSSVHHGYYGYLDRHPEAVLTGDVIGLENWRAATANNRARALRYWQQHGRQRNAVRRVASVENKDART